MIYIITGGREYYALNDGEIYKAYIDECYLYSFLRRMDIEFTELRIHPDITHGNHGCECGMSNIIYSDFASVNDIPKWFYSYDRRQPLIKQLTKEEFEEFVSMNFALCYNPYTGQEWKEKHDKEWYKENGHR